MMLSYAFYVLEFFVTDIALKRLFPLVLWNGLPFWVHKASLCLVFAEKRSERASSFRFSRFGPNAHFSRGFWM